MQKQLLSLCVATALGAAAAPALAVGPGDVPADNNLFIGGATATNRVLGRFLVYDDTAVGEAAQMCEPGTINVFNNRATQATSLNDVFTTSAGSQYLVICRGGDGTSFDGENIAVYKESLGGSGNGVDPVSLQTDLTFLNVGSQVQAALTNAGTGCTGNALFAAVAGTNLAFQQWWGCGTLTPQSVPPTVGVSDVNPELLTINATVEEDLGPRALGTIDIVFAPVVGQRTYRAMQTLSGLESTCGTDNNSFEEVGGTTPPTGAPATDDCDEAVNVPSLTEAQIRAIYTSFITSSNVITDDAGTSNIAMGQWFICRRGSVSGTQASFESKLLGNRCLPDSQVSLFSGATGTGATNGCTDGGCAWNATTYGGDRIFAGFGSSDVVSCMLHHDNLGRAVIGVLSTETTPGGLNTTGPVTGGALRYIGINGAVPDLLNTAAGNYPLWTSNTWNTSANVSFTAVQDSVQGFIQSSMAQPTIVRALNTGFNYGFFQGGILAQSPANTPANPPYTRANITATPINPNSHGLGTGVQNCAPPMNTGLGTSEIGGEGEELNTALGQ